MTDNYNTRNYSEPGGTTWNVGGDLEQIYAIFDTCCYFRLDLTLYRGFTASTACGAGSVMQSLPGLCYPATSKLEHAEMTQTNPQYEFLQLMLSMSDPQQRQNSISQIPEHLQTLFTDRNKQFEIIGQDGTQALVDWQNSILSGQPLQQSSIDTLTALREKLLATNSKAVVI